MFPTANPPGTWLAGHATAGRSHDYRLGIDVRWLDAPSTTLADASLTFTASVDW